jgi:hypothetical protein
MLVCAQAKLFQVTILLAPFSKNVAFYFALYLHGLFNCEPGRNLASIENSRIHVLISNIILVCNQCFIIEAPLNFTSG